MSCQMTFLSILSKAFSKSIKFRYNGVCHPFDCSMIILKVAIWSVHALSFLNPAWVHRSCLSKAAESPTLLNCNLFHSNRFSSLHFIYHLSPGAKWAHRASKSLLIPTKLSSCCWACKHLSCTNASFFIPQGFWSVGFLAVLAETGFQFFFPSISSSLHALRKVQLFLVVILSIQIVFHFH